ncbi:unnamed protein product [Rotaria socialis]|uniref:Poly [ADP-ribose] polymerase n=1 Tax=Rotaria socialis TaxID=392032 RepID=A0A818CU15_9BILA|nr:unnamed protein product [Rotaria socialis]
MELAENSNFQGVFDQLLSISSQFQDTVADQRKGRSQTPPLQRRGSFKSLASRNISRTPSLLRKSSENSVFTTDGLSDVLQTIDFPVRSNVQIRKGDLTKQKVDVIVVCLSSDILREYVLQAAGSDVRKQYEKGKRTTDQALALWSPVLPCQQILFLPWVPSQHDVLLEQSIREFIALAIQYVLDQNYTSVAFPAIGCGRFGLDIAFIAASMYHHIIIEKYPINITFVIQPSHQEVFDAFQRAQASTLAVSVLPHMWTYTNEQRTLRLPLKINTVEYNTIINEFNKTMFGQYTRINRIERIQNERWHKQYMLHRADFKKSLKMNTEKFLYHGCPDVATSSIIQDYFNRSFAGKNGTLYGHGVYFSSNAQYSHAYAVPNKHGERCMFFARVLIGRTTLGDNTMKVCPKQYHTTTDGQHIYVTYHDTQAYGQYLICYQ